MNNVLTIVLGPPIIVVPGGVASIITLYNVKDFLEDGKFVPTMDKKKAIGQKPPSVSIKHYTHDGRTVNFIVIDSTDKLRPQDWYESLVYQ